jgi:hypothetical protein
MGVNNPAWSHVGTNKRLFSFKRRPLIGNTETSEYVFGPQTFGVQPMLGAGLPVQRQLGTFAPQVWTNVALPVHSDIGSGTQYAGTFGVQALITVNSAAPGN